MDHELEVLPSTRGGGRGGRLLRRQAGARMAVTEHGRFTFAVSGGHTPWAMFAALAAQDVPWEQVVIYQVDERVAPEGDPDRNLTHLLASLGECPGRGDPDAGERRRSRRGGGALRRIRSRRASTSCISASVPTGTPHRSSPATPSSRHRSARRGHRPYQGHRAHDAHAIPRFAAPTSSSGSSPAPTSRRRVAEVARRRSADIPAATCRRPLVSLDHAL